MRAAIYARFSTDHQREASVEDQTRLCRVRAEREGWSITCVHADHGVSGSTPVSARAGGTALLADALADRFDVLLLEGLDRLSRDLVEQERIVRRLEHVGIRIVGISDGYDSQSQARKLHRGMRGLINEIYLDDLRAKVHRGLDGQFARGFFAGGLSYGYKSITAGDDGHRLKIDETQAAVVRDIFEQYAAGRGCRAIARELNRRGVPSPRGSTWAVSAIYGNCVKGCGILNNDLYRGEYIWNRSEWVKDPDTGKRKRRERPAHEWRRREIPELRIISEDLWQSVKRRQETKRISGGGRGRGRPVSTLLGGLITCGICGAPVIAVDARRYGCSHSHDRGREVCRGVYAARQATERTVLSIIVDDMLAPAALAALQADVRAVQREQLESASAGQKARRARLAQLDREIENLTDAVASMGGSSALQARLAKAEAEHRRLTAENVTVPALEETIDEIPNLLGEYRELLADLPPVLSEDVPRARSLVRDVLGGVRMVPDNNGDVFAEVAGYGEAIKISTDSTLTKLVAGARLRANLPRYVSRW